MKRSEELIMDIIAITAWCTAFVVIKSFFWAFVAICAIIFILEAMER